jgi:hypothetical protein
MKDRYFVRTPRPLGAWAIFLLLLLTILSGCQAKEPPLSPAAAAFKKEILDCLDRLCQGLITSIVKKDVAAINETLKHLEPETLKLCRMCPFRIGILDKTGSTLTVFPYKEEAMGNFSGYEAVAQTLKDHLINQQRMFLQDGAQIYVVCIPLLQQENLVGIMVLSLSADEAKKRWGLTEPEFQAINFNLRKP